MPRLKDNSATHERKRLTETADLRVLRDERVEYEEEVDLGVYDEALRLLEGGDRRAADELGA